MKIDPFLQAQVDGQLIEQGAFSTIDLLINCGRLEYGDYERWRRRELETLDEVLMGDVQKITAEMAQTSAYARAIGLIEEPQEFHSWGNDASPALLKFSRDAKLNAAMSARYVPAQNVRQQDLFFHNPITALTNGIAGALAARNAREAQRLLDLLYAQAPTHPDLAAYDRLCGAIAGLELPVDSCEDELHSMLELMPLAKRLLSSHARDFLVPLWRRLGRALNQYPFDSQSPDLHASFAFEQAQDWVAVRERVSHEQDWRHHSALALRMARACSALGDRPQAMTAWFQLCWRHPDFAERALESRHEANLILRHAWLRFAESEDFGDALTIVEFPAWYLLNEPGLVQFLSEDLAQGCAADESYRLVHRWLQARRAKQDSDQMALRKALSASHPGLFRVLRDKAGQDANTLRF
jgi:hypothetical protein